MRRTRRAIWEEPNRPRLTLRRTNSRQHRAYGTLIECVWVAPGRRGTPGGLMASSSDSLAEIHDGPPPEWLRAETVICSRFVVGESLGSGSEARAFLCRDQLTDEPVVCRVAKCPADAAIKRQYLRLRALRSAALPFPIGYFEHLAAGDVWPVLAVDHAQGLPLRQWAPRSSVRDRLGALAQLAEALAELEGSSGDGHGDSGGPKCDRVRGWPRPPYRSRQRSPGRFERRRSTAYTGSKHVSASA